MQEGGDNLRLLLHAPAQFLHFFLTVFGQAKPFQPPGQTPAGGLFVQAFQRRQVDEGRFQLLIFVQAPLFWQVADAPFVGQV